MIIMVFNPYLGHSFETKRNFKHLVHETHPPLHAWAVFKFYKKQTKSKNNEIWQNVMISYVEAVVKNWEGFTQVVTHIAHNPKQLQRSFMIVENDLVWFGVKAMVELWFDSQTFCIANRHRRSYHITFW